MADWKPRLRAGLRWESLHLTPEEGFLLSRVDGATSVAALRQVTGLTHERVSHLLAKLEHQGAIEPEPSSSSTIVRAAPSFTREDEPPTRQKLRHTHPNDDVVDDDADLIRRAMADLKQDASLLGDDTDEGEAVGDLSADDSSRAAHQPSPQHAVGHAGTAAMDDDDDDDDADDADDADDEGDNEDDEGGAEQADATAKVHEGTARALFETTLHPLPAEEREQLARAAEGATLLALCFDPVHRVVAALLENAHTGLAHARLVARHHRTPQGLEALFARRPEFVRDRQVQRWLLANPMLGESHLKRLLSPKPLVQVYTWSLSRDLPEHNRGKVRALFRHKWGVADGEERANLVWSCEGRCLQALTGLQLDSKATTLLCARSIHSVMLVQSLCRFSATPPPLLAHLARQPVVKRQPNLRMLITQHPNCPAELKRSLRSPSS